MPSTPAVEAIFPKLLNESQKDWASQLMETIAEEAGANWSPESFAERRLLQEKERVARFEEGRQFTKFGELIPELRREIWKHLLPGPRIIPFYPASEAPLYPELDMNSTIWDSVVSDTNIIDPIPTALLHACHESRQLALEHYSICFSCACGPVGPGLYIDYQIDTVFFERPQFIKWILDHQCPINPSANNTPQMRNLAIRMNPTIDPKFDTRVMISDAITNFYRDLAKAMSICTGLKSLTLEVIHEALLALDKDGELSLHRGTVDLFSLAELEHVLKWGWRYAGGGRLAKGEDLELTFLGQGQMYCFFPKGWKENPWEYL